MTDEAAIEEQPELKGDHPPEVYLQRIAQELRTIRIQISQGLSYMRNAEAEIPEMMRRFMNYMHDCHDIHYMYEERGLPVPRWILNEMERCDDRLRQLLQKEHSEGVLGKVRTEMAEDPENRWDHKKALTYKRET